MENDLKASPEVLAATQVLRAEIDRIWESAWRATFEAVTKGIKPDEFVALLNSNPVFSSLFIEMQNSVHVWIKAGMSVDKIPPAYSVTRTKLQNLFLEVNHD
jgi:hypothetical protein